MVRTNLILSKASAGSGKTFMLAKTYVQIVLNFEHEQHCYYDRILAVTFTNKATEEMKSRILKFLTEISLVSTPEEAQESDITRILLSENPTWTYQLLAWKAKVALSKILHDYSQFSIMTIDKFFNRIVKSFLFELKLQNTANVSMDTQQALDEALAEILNEYSHDDQHLLSRWLKEIATENVEDGKRWQPEDVIKKLSGELFKEHVARLDLNYPIEKVESLLNYIREVENNFKTTVSKLAQEIDIIIQREQLGTGFFNRNIFPNQTQKIIQNPLEQEYGKLALDIILSEENPFVKNAQKHPEAARYFQVWQQEIQPKAAALVQFRNENFIEVNTVLAFKKYLKALALLSNVSDKMKEYRERNGIMLISDNNQLIHKVVGNTETSFLYEKIGNKFRYILLDEFQDTSTLQWKNFLPLIVEILSHREDCKVLIVGDAKQAIYRWRGGNFQLIQHVVKNDLKTYWDEANSLKPLNSNFRSYTNIVKFNNELFSKLAPAINEFVRGKENMTLNYTELSETLKELYDDVAQESFARQQGYVEVKFLEKERPGETEEEYDEQEQVKDYLKNTISRLTREKGYSFNDIAVLVRKNKEAVEIADVLKSEGYDVMTSEALLFNAHPVVQLLIHTLELLLHPTEDLYRTAVLYQYAKVHSLDAEHADLLDEGKRNQYFAQWLSGLSEENILDVLGALSIYEIVRKLVDILNLREYRDAYTEQFLDMVMQYQSGAYQASIIDFIDWWKVRERSVAISGEANAIQIVTIHKSKGLEYKVVILPYFNWQVVETSHLLQPILWPELHNPDEMEGFKTLPMDFNKARDSFYIKDYQDEMILQAADNLNIAYVALTRAAEKMYILCPLKRTKDGISKDRISGMMHHCLQDSAVGFFEDKLIYKVGEEDNKIVKEKYTDEVFKEISIQENSISKTAQLSPLRRQNEEAVTGDMIHEILSVYRPGADLEKLLLMFSHRFVIKEEQRQEIFQRIRKFFLHPEIQHIYALEGQILTERTFAYNQEIHRFDLLILNGKVGRLYDFKTGLEKSNQSKNTEMLKLYRTALEDMGYEIKVTAFIFIDHEGLPKFEYIE